MGEAAEEDFSLWLYAKRKEKVRGKEGGREKGIMIDPLKVQDSLIDFNVTEYEKFHQDGSRVHNTTFLLTIFLLTLAKF